MKIVVREQLLGVSRTLVRDYLPEIPSSEPLLWVHGGGFAGGSIDMPESDAVARWFAATGRPVRTVEYRLAPALPQRGPLNLDPAPGRYPAAKEDVLVAFLDLAQHSPSYLGGASAGACIAASVALQLREDDGPRPRGLALAYGVFHGRLPTPSGGNAGHSQPEADLAEREWVERMTLNYAGTPQLQADPKVFPGEGNPVGLPPALILDADNDGLRVSSQRFAEQLRVAGVVTTELVIADAAHGFLNDPESVYFQHGVTSMLRWLTGAGRHE